MIDAIATCTRRAQQFRESARAVELRLAEERNALLEARKSKDERTIRCLEALVGHDQTLSILLSKAAENLDEVRRS